MESFAIFSKFFNILSNFSRKFGQNLEICIFRGFPGPEPPEAREFMKNFVEKLMETGDFW